MSGFARYDSYKDSGVEWLGEIPDHWSIHRMKFVGRIKTGEMDTIDKQDKGSYPFFVRSQIVERINTYSYDEEAVLTAGDGVGVGKVFHYINGKFEYHQRVYKISHFREVHGKFLYYYMQANLANEVLKLSAKSTVDSLRLPMLQNFPIVKGSIAEQTRIVTFLDQKTAEIDEAIAKKQRLIDLLQEQKAILINQAVTKGLNPDAPMRDSGVEWIGEIPAHWAVKRLKHIATIEYGIAIELTDSLKGIPILSLPNVSILGELNTNNLAYIELNKSEYNRYLLRKGDLLFNWRNGSPKHVGKTAIFNLEDEYTHVSFLLRIRMKSTDVVPRYVQYYLNSLRAVGFFSTAKIQINSTFNKSELSDFPLVVPPQLEQREILEHARIRVTEINSVMDNAIQEIQLLKEMKNVAIANAVTGKIKI